MAEVHRRAGDHRLADMSAPVVPDQRWVPELPAFGEPLRIPVPLSADAGYEQKLWRDELDRLVKWAVVQQWRRPGDELRRVAVYDTCAGHDAHVHLLDRREVEFDKHDLGHGTIRSRRDLETSLDCTLEWIERNWQENQRRSDRGRG